jgi:5-formyltetrahydrofolate cyclo-ligase
MNQSDIVSAKKTLRSEMRKIFIPEPVVLSKKIVDCLVEYISAHSEFKMIALFSPMVDEPDITSLVKIFPERRFVFPKINENYMKFYLVDNIEIDLSIGTFGILEPKVELHAILPSEIDLFLCPGIAFGKNGERLGRGRGYYDRYLFQYECGIPQKIGVIFSLKFISSVPRERHDVMMNCIVTEFGMVSCIK